MSKFWPKHWLIHVSTGKNVYAVQSTNHEDAWWQLMQAKIVNGDEGYSAKYMRDAANKERKILGKVVRHPDDMGVFGSVADKIEPI